MSSDSPISIEPSAPTSWRCVPANGALHPASIASEHLPRVGPASHTLFEWTEYWLSVPGAENITASGVLLDLPLKIVLAWCLDPNSPNLATVTSCIASTSTPQEMEQALLGLTFHFPRTAERTIRLLWTAHVEGFAAFG